MSQSPKSKTAFHYSVLVLLALCIGYASFRLARSYKQSNSEKELSDVSQRRGSDSNTYPYDISADLFDRSPNSNDPRSGADSIPDELIATFSSEASLEAFLRNAGGSAFQVIGYNRKLRSARIRIIDRINTLTTLSKLGVSIDNNYTLLNPLPVASAVTTSNAAFGNTALEFLRVPYGNQAAGSGVKIAIIDSGIRSHTTLSESQITEFDLIADSTSSTYASHGTAVASLIAGNNGNGITPAAELLSIRVLDSDGIGDTFSLAEGIVKAVEEGAQIINLSVASYGTNAALEAAVNYALENDVVLVAAAGNESLAALPYPAAYEGVISVSAVDALGYPTEFSNQSESIDVAAPGVGVYAAWEEEEWVSFTGTSAATPYVTGAIAYLASSLPNTSPSEAAALLIANADDTGLPGADNQTGSGYIDIQRAIDASTSYTDAALASIYLSPDENADGSQTLYFTAQNRGTEAIEATHLEITLDNGITQTIYLGSLSPSQVTSYQIDVTQSQLSAANGFPVAAKVVSNSLPDQYPENDAKEITLIPSP